MRFPSSRGRSTKGPSTSAACASKTGYITLDDGYGNTGSCKSAITFIDGDAGILRYRGIPIEDLAGAARFIEAAWLLIFGRLPTIEDRERFAHLLTENVDARTRTCASTSTASRPTRHPMAILSAMINALSAHDCRRLHADDDEAIERAAAVLMSQGPHDRRRVVQVAHRRADRLPALRPQVRRELPAHDVLGALPRLRADARGRPQGAQPVPACCTPTTSRTARRRRCGWSPLRRRTCSPRCSAGVCALWGPLHGGANVAVIEMLEQIRASGHRRQGVRRARSRTRTTA